MARAESRTVKKLATVTTAAAAAAAALSSNMEGNPKAACLEALDAAGAVYELIEHGAAPTVDEHTKQLSAWRETEGAMKQCAQVKNLVLKDKKGKLYLISCDKESTIDMKALSIRLDVPKSSPLRMASSEIMTSALNVQPGSVTPLCVAFIDPRVSASQSHEIVVLLDEHLKGCESVLVHPMTNDATIVMNPLQLESFIQKSISLTDAAEGESSRISMTWVDFSESSKISVGNTNSSNSEKKETTKADSKSAPKKTDKRAKLKEEQQNAADNKPDGPPENGVPASAFKHVQWSESIFRRPQPL